MEIDRENAGWIHGWRKLSGYLKQPIKTCRAFPKYGLPIYVMPSGRPFFKKAEVDEWRAIINEGNLPTKQIYFIISDDEKYLKIGISASPEKRLISMQVGCPLKLKILGTIPGHEKTEEKMQMKFKKYKVSGEWFSFDKEIRQEINLILDKKNEPIKMLFDSLKERS